MVDLTARLGLTEGTNRVIADPATPSGIGAALDFATDALNGYSKLKQDVSSQKAAKKAADTKQRQAEIAFQVTGLPSAAARDVAASQQASIAASASANETAQLSADTQAAVSPLTPAEDTTDPFAVLAEDDTGVFTGPPSSITPSMESAVNREITGIKNVITAVDQGRMPPISMQAAISSRFAALREKFPNDTEYLLDMVKKAGIDPALYTEMKDAVDEHNFQRDQEQSQRSAAQKRDEDAIDAATKTLGPDAIGMSRADLIVHGLGVMRKSAALDLQSRQTAIQLQQSGLTKEKADDIKKDHNEGIFADINGAIYNQAVPVIRTIENLSASLLKDPNSAENLQRWQQNGVRLHQMIPQIAENALQRAIHAGYTGDPEAFKKRIMDIYGPLTDLFTGDHSVVQASIDALRGIETIGKISTARALPFMTSLTRAGVKVTEMPGFLKVVDGNPDLQKRLHDEINGFVTDWGADRASTHLMTAIKLMRGETTLAYMDPAEARRQIPTLVTANRALAKDYVAGKDVDGEKILHTTGEIAVATRSLSPSSGSAVLYVATQGFANPSTRNALIKTLTDRNVPDHDMALATVQASRAASAHTLNNVRLAVGAANKTSPYFHAVWDERNGKYVIQKTPAFAEMAKRGNAPKPYLSRFGMDAVTPAMRSAAVNMEPPRVLQQLVDAGNMNLDNAIELGRHDPSTPNASDNQLRNWYGQERPLPPDPSQKNIDPTKEVGKQLDNLEKMVTETFDKALTPVKPAAGDGERRERSKRGSDIVVPAVATMEQDHANNPIFSAFKAAADKYGIPKDVALRLGYLEGKFADHGVNSAGASGPAQVRGFNPRTGKAVHDTESMQLFGKPVKDLTPEENVDLGMRILSREAQKTGGDWRTAVKRYLGAEKGDVNLTGEQYANLIF